MPCVIADRRQAISNRGGCHLSCGIKMPTPTNHGNAKPWEGHRGGKGLSALQLSASVPARFLLRAVSTVWRCYLLLTLILCLGLHLINSPEQNQRTAVVDPSPGCTTDLCSALGVLLSLKKCHLQGCWEGPMGRGLTL